MEINFEDKLLNKYKFLFKLKTCICMIRWMIKNPLSKSKRNCIGKKSKIICKRKLDIHNKVRIGNNVLIDCISREGVCIKDNVSIGDNVIIKCTWNLDDIGTGITIGKGTIIGYDSFFGGAGGIIIGDNVITGQNVRFHSENHKFDRVDIPIKYQGVTHKGIVIGDDCWIGAGAVFLDGVVVGKGSVIGANSLVTSNIPEYSVAVGNPARIIKVRG